MADARPVGCFADRGGPSGAAELTRNSTQKIRSIEPVLLDTCRPTLCLGVSALMRERRLEKEPPESIHIVHEKFAP